ncbi:hypothetical protein [Archangium sp.]|uniref:YkgJ family cysteine cluster protein n=1 Tax=Archangium sp. TaxID=1872627 RepID=UPI00286A7756|nr:hypothetical protein [Archangium sp.]
MEPLTEPLTVTRLECRVYAHRPMACRTYGFYWGNQDSLEDTLQRLSGATLSLFEWFAAHPPGSTSGGAPPTGGC